MKTQLQKSLRTVSTIFATTLFILGILSIAIPKFNNTQDVRASDTNTPYLNTASWQRTASIIPWNKGEFSTPEFKQAIDKAKNAGFNEISLHIQLFQSSLRDNELYLAPFAPTDLELTNAISYINSIGLNTSMKFFVDVDYTKGNFWRAYIDPTDRPLWFKNYTTFIKKYAQIAEQNNVKSLSLGTELYYLAKDSTDYNTIGWNKLIDHIRSLYSGKLTYGYNHAGENDNGELKFIEKLDFIGISGYYPVTNNPNASVAEIEANWDGIIKTKLNPIYNKYKKPIVFTELGYRSISEAVNAPWDSNISGTLSVATQANLYEGLIRSLSKVDYFQGWHTWDWGTTADVGGLTDKSFTPQNKPAEKILAKYYRYNGGEVPANWEYVKPVIFSTSSSTTSLTSLSTSSLTESPSSSTTSSDSSTSSSSSSLTTSSTSSSSQSLALPSSSSSSTSSLSTSTSSTSSSSTTTSAPVTKKPLEVSIIQDKADPTKLILSIQNNQTTPYQNVVVDLEIYNQEGTKVDQVIKFNQAIRSNNVNYYEFEYNPKINGKYLIKLGLFDNSWKLIEWYNDMGIYDLSTTTPVSATTSSQTTTSIAFTSTTAISKASTSSKSLVKQSQTSSTNLTNSVKTSLKSSQTSSPNSKSSNQTSTTNDTTVNIVKVLMGSWTAVALALKK